MTFTDIQGHYIAVTHKTTGRDGSAMSAAEIHYRCVSIVLIQWLTTVHSKNMYILYHLIDSATALSSAENLSALIPWPSKL